MNSRKIVPFMFLLVTILLTTANLALGKEVISNSADWRDVYSVILYGNLGGGTPRFLTGTPHGPILLYELPKNADGIEIYTSAEKPYYIGYEALMRSKGFENIEEVILDSANLELARRLPNINNFIIIDDVYGYNALAAAPYAAKANYYVLFANRRNIDDIQTFLSTKNVGKIIIYGQTDREVRNGLAQYNPEILNSETGSRFENNMMIVDKYAEIGNIKQAILTNGEFIETSMMTGNEPVLFIGKNNVPPEIKSYIQKKGVEIGVLIGNELIGTATDIRRDVGISVFVKFARGSRIPGGTINPVEDLDRFPMPRYQLSLSIVSISYNRATGQLEVTYRNNVDLASYFRTTITVKDSNGETLVVDGDEDVIFIDGGETKTVVYSKIGSVEAQKLTSDLSAEIYTIYGESKTSLENVIRGTFPIEMIDIADDAEIEIRDLAYDKNRGRFIITIENTGEADAYVNVELVELWVNEEYVTVSSDSTTKIQVGKSAEIPVSIRLEQEDLESSRNAEITVRAIYGERMHALIKVKTKKFNLRILTLAIQEYAMIGGAIALLVLLLLLFFKRKKKRRCPRCRESNDKDAHTCRKCGHNLRHH
ncbi:zinc ribbon domain-containing protein [Candidatus Woesearchaeota archaeon]|nr:zinc ribbon domain-containing protein [Candidatus Woesearchaeota archaeon]